MAFPLFLLPDTLLYENKKSPTIVTIWLVWLVTLYYRHVANVASFLKFIFGSADKILDLSY